MKRYVRRVRPQPGKEPVVRFETAPGQQGQVDFAEFRLPWGKRDALLVVLGYSRLLWFQFYARRDRGYPYGPRSLGRAWTGTGSAFLPLCPW